MDAVTAGWFRPGTRALDVGCGEGDIAAWLGSHGFAALGIDFAVAAIDRARQAHGEALGRLEFQVADVCSTELPQRWFGAIVDRGCFHGIPPNQRHEYVRNIAAASTADARLQLLVKAFRDQRPVGDQAEREQKVSEVRAAFSGEFEIDRVAETYLDATEGRDPARARGGLVFWMTRSPTGLRRWAPSRLRLRSGGPVSWGRA